MMDAAFTLDSSLLSAPQRRAVEYVDGPSLVIAGAGSGKTRVLTYKIAHLLTLGYEPWRIMALTFTNKAATEMRERIANLIGPDQARPLWMGTFHSIFLRILRMECDSLPFAPNFTIYDERDSLTLIKSIIKEMGLEDGPYKATSVLNTISMAKAQLVDADAYAAIKENAQADARHGKPALGRIFQQYAERCRRANAMDFDDILLFTYQLFKQHEDLRIKYARRFRFVLVDEYQDTNYAQHEIIWQLTQDHQHLCVVGDDAQSIYSFRGARIDNILLFSQRYTNCRLFKLEQNYRSTQMIVNAANSLIHRNADQIEKQVFSKNALGQPITLTTATSDIGERELVTAHILRLHGRDHVPYDQMAILYRTHAQSRLFEEALLKKGVPYRIYGGTSFYQRKEVKDAVAYFRLVANPNDDESFRRIINVPKRGLGQVSLQKIIDAANLHSVSLFTVISHPADYDLVLPRAAAKQVEDFRKMVDDCHRRMDSEPAIRIGKDILLLSGLQKELANDNSPEGLDKQSNIEELVNAMAEFCRLRTADGNEQISLTDYLSEISLLSAIDNKPGQAPSDGQAPLALMTVHAAKGLEFDIVFIVGMEDELFPNERSLASNAALQEERRLFYVAITRAKRECHISSAESRFRNGQYTICRESMFIGDIDPQFVRRMPSGHATAVRRARYDDVPLPWQKKTTSTPVRSPQPVPIANPRMKPVRSVVSSSQPPSPQPSSPAQPPSSPSQSNSSLFTLHSSLYRGMRISHERFGEGTIQAVEGQGINRKISVQFDTCGNKQLLIRFAKFKVLS